MFATAHQPFTAPVQRAQRIHPAFMASQRRLTDASTRCKYYHIATAATDHKPVADCGDGGTPARMARWQLHAQTQARWIHSHICASGIAVTAGGVWGGGARGDEAAGPHTPAPGAATQPPPSLPSLLLLLLASVAAADVAAAMAPVACDATGWM